MVARCLSEWPYDNFRTKCEAPVDKLTYSSYSSSDLYAYLPVLGHDSTTFRNMYCAICNGVERFDPWPIQSRKPLISPTSVPGISLENHTLTEKIRFMLSRGVVFKLWTPGKNQARRYCLDKLNVIDSCSPSELHFESCINGDVALISLFPRHFKNKHCAACHVEPSEIFSCFSIPYVPPTCRQSISLVLRLDHSEIEAEIKTQVYDEECGRSGMIFDDILQVCRANWLSPLEQNGQERFYVYAWLKPLQYSQNNLFTPTEFKDSLVKYMNVSQFQLFDINITTVLLPRTINLFYLVSSTIVLTPQQSLELFLMNATSSETKLLNYIYFSKGLPFTVTKTTSRPLALHVLEKQLIHHSNTLYMTENECLYQVLTKLTKNLNITGKTLKNLM